MPVSASGIWRRVAIGFLLACIAAIWSPASARADSDGSAYGFGNILVFDTLVTDKVTYRSTRLLNVVPLDDRSPLRVAGRVAMPGKSAYIAAYGDYNRKLIVLLWERVEIYDLSDPTNPRLVASLDLGDQGFSSAGEPLIEKAGEGKFVLLNTRNTSELAVDGDEGKWTVKPLPPPDAAQKARMSEPPAAVLAFRKPTSTPLILRESDQFRYELGWSDKRQPGRIAHRKYVRKLDKSGTRMVSEFLLSTDIETID